MSLLTAILILAAIGFITWVIVTYIPMEKTIRNVIIVFVLFAVIVWALNLMGVLGTVKEMQVPQVK